MMNLENLKKLILNTKEKGSLFDGKISSTKDLELIIDRFHLTNESNICFCFCKKGFTSKFKMMKKQKSDILIDDIWDYMIYFRGAKIFFLEIEGINNCLFAPLINPQPYNCIVA